MSPHEERIRDIIRGVIDGRGRMGTGSGRHLANAILWKLIEEGVVVGIPGEFAHQSAATAIDDILYDLCDRCGLKDEWARIDEEVQAEIKNAWHYLIMRQVYAYSGAVMQRLAKALNALNNTAIESIGDKKFCVLCHTIDGHESYCLLSEDYAAIVRKQRHENDGGKEPAAQAVVNGVVICGRYIHAQDRPGILACPQEDSHDGPCTFTDYVA